METTRFGRAHVEHRQLLINLKTTIEIVFLNNKYCGVTGVAAEGLLRLHTCIEQIFINGIRVHKPDNSPDLWQFIEGLNWINPQMTASITATATSNIHIPYSRIRNDRSLRWIYENLLVRKLSHKLKYLVSDAEHLNTCYDTTAFLQNINYLQAFLICLRAVENNQPNLLSQIDPILYKNVTERLQHKRSTSHPDFSYVPKMKNEQCATQKSSQNCDDDNNKSPRLFPWSDYPDYAGDHQQRSSRIKSKKRRIKRKSFISLKLRPWRSLPDLQEVFSKSLRSRSKTISQPVCIPTQKLSADALTTANYIKSHSFTFTSDLGSSCNPSAGTSGQSNHVPIADLIPISLIKCDDIKIHFDRKFIRKPAGNSSSIPTIAKESTKLTNQLGFFSFIPRHRDATGDGDKNQSPTTTTGFTFGSAPSDFVHTFLPIEGKKIRKPNDVPVMEIINQNESLFISPNSRPIVGQSLTSFLQTAQFSRTNSELERENAHFSVSEAMISAIEQIKWRNLEKLRMKKLIEIETLRTGVKKKRRCSGNLRTWQSKDNFLDGELSSDSSMSSANFSATDSSDDDDINYLQGLSVSSHSINDHTAYAEWGDSNIDTLSAESVALSLISKFSDKQLPRASDLLWLVSEQDVPQKLLPIPGSRAINPDEIYKIPFTRGTRDWAPPRPQIIFTRHPPIDRKKQLLCQNHRCAGCGMKVATAYSHRFRYCEYVGKFFCTGCHRNHISTIPARVLDRWNFTCYPVSVFSYRLLDQIWTFPLFRVSDLNKELYEKVKALQLAKIRREQLKFIQDFIVSCRFADEHKRILDSIPSYTANDPDIWSMSDFVSVKNGFYMKDLNALITKYESHVFQCELCTARGFICELCPRKQVIFPWQTKIKRCEKCGVCVHERCWKNDCTKCQRLRKRQAIIGIRTS